MTRKKRRSTRTSQKKLFNLSKKNMEMYNCDLPSTLKFSQLAADFCKSFQQEIATRTLVVVVVVVELPA